MKKIILYVAVFILSAGMLSFSSANADLDSGSDKDNIANLNKATDFLPASDSNFEFKVAENAKYELMGRADGIVAVKDKSSGFMYSTNPLEKDPLAKSINMTNLQSQLLIKSIDSTGTESSTNSAAGSVNKGWLSYEAVDQGIKYYYDFQNLGIVIPLQYSLEVDGLKVEVLLDEIVDEVAGHSLVEFSVLPFFGAAGIDSQGYTLVPDGSGALIYHNNDKASYGAYSQYVYGRDIALTTEKRSVVQEDVCLPIFGMKDGDHGYLAIIEQGETNAKINAMTSGTINSYNNVYASFRYRVTGTADFIQGNLYAHDGKGDSAVVVIKSPILSNLESYSIKYLLINETDLDYGDMARVYREYLIENKGLKKNEILSSPLYLEILGGLVMEDYILGMPINRLRPLTTYEEAIEILDKIKEIGVEDIVMKYSGWQHGGLDSMIPAKIRFENKLGGKSGYEKLVAYVEKADVELYPNMDFVNVYKSGNGYSVYNDVAQTLGTTPAYQYMYDLNLLTKYKDKRWYILSPTLVPEAFASMYKGKEGLKTDNISLSTLGNKLYSDFTNSEKGIDRSDSLKLWENMLHTASQGFTSVMVDTGYAYSLPYVDKIYDAPTTSSKFDIQDETIPFYQMVLHGYVSYSTEPINLSYDPELLLLKAVETGSSLAFCFMDTENHVLKDTQYNYIFSGNYKTWLQTIDEFYHKVKDVLNETSNYTIVNHEKISNNLYKTTYENGAVVYVNYGYKDVKMGEITIGGRDFVYINGREKK